MKLHSDRSSNTWLTEPLSTKLQIKRGVSNTIKQKQTWKHFKYTRLKDKGSPKLGQGEIAHTLFTLNFFEIIVPYTLTLNKIACYLGDFSTSTAETHSTWPKIQIWISLAFLKAEVKLSLKKWNQSKLDQVELKNSLYMISASNHQSYITTKTLIAKANSLPLTNKQAGRNKSFSNGCHLQLIIPMDDTSYFTEKGEHYNS